MQIESNHKKNAQAAISRQPLKAKLIPLVLTLAIIIIDQITKYFVVKHIPLYSIFNDDCVIPVVGDYIRLIHVRNKAVAFSLGSSLPSNIRKILFAIMPLIVIGMVFGIYFRNNEFNKLQRWAICGIIGGGLGNLIDRFFRPQGVVDFVDCYFWGLFNMERWPTFNAADVAVIICGILFIYSFARQIVKDTKKAQKS